MKDVQTQETLGDRLWIWGHEVGSHDSYIKPRKSTITPIEAAKSMGLTNLIMVRYEGKPAPPYESYARPFASLRQFVWSIVGGGGHPADGDFDAALDLAARFPNMTGVIMDDFFQVEASDTFSYTVEQLRDIRKRLHSQAKPLDLWTVVYLDRSLEKPIAPYLAECDVITAWTWWAGNLPRLESNLTRLEAMAPGKRIVLGCYLYDYGGNKPMPQAAMEEQCRLGLRWLQEGRIEGMVFLASCVCDQPFEAVEWTRSWIRAVKHPGSFIKK
ncbi:MAG: hypothetical protein PHR35_17090 [Kiritimatiellae bacterium]|nr:hypothetical protein [Kiritimatiellia bacterium]